MGYDGLSVAVMVTVAIFIMAWLFNHFPLPFYVLMILAWVICFVGGVIDWIDWIFNINIWGLM